MSSPIPNPTGLSLQFQDIFDAALREYRLKTGKDIATHPLTAKFNDCDSSDAVLRILEEQAHAFDEFLEGDRKDRLMRQLKPTFDILLGLSTSDVVVGGITLIFPPANVIFAGVGVLLAAAKGVSTSYDALIDLFECFEHYLGRLKVLTEIPSAVGEILVKIMVELLEVLALATQQISRGRFKKFAKKLLGENDIEAVLQRLDRLTMEESRMTATQTMEVVYGLFKNMKVVMDDGKASIDNIREALVSMQSISDNLNKMRCDQLREKIQKWLSPPDPSINHNTQCEAHHSGSAMWFVEGPVYNKWKATGSLLWTHGNPGSGKSVLCSSIIRDIESIRATGLASFAYYYFDFKDAGKQDRRGLLSSLLMQLCTRSHHGYDILSSLYEAHENGLRQPSEVDLIRCLKDIIALPGHGRVYIIVDAVDESPNKPGIRSPREKVLQLMKELADLHHPDIRVCITSRPEVDIQMVLEPLASHTVSLHDERGQKSDIINYIESVVKSDANMRRWRSEDRQLVIDLLSKKVDGMFRWVVCQLDALRRGFPSSIRRAVNELPMTLDETYERILLGIDREKREHAIRLLKCLAFSRRPLLVKELAEVLAIQFHTAIPSLDTNLRPGEADKAVLSACSTLVSVIKPDGSFIDNNDARIVQFSHYSVKEFLTSGCLAESDRRELSQYHISPESAHTILAQTCVSTLIQPDLHIGYTTDSFPLVEYAAQNWFHHAQSDRVASQIQDGMECLFDPDKKHLTVWVSIHNIDHAPSRSRPSGLPNSPESSPLYYATLCGFGSLVEYLISTHHQDPNKSYGGWGTPLHAAVVLGHTAIAKFLLEHGARVNAQDKNDSTPLHEASESGNLDITELLLSHPADVNLLDYRGDSPLRRAFRCQKFDAMKRLVEGGADVNARDQHDLTPLQEASGSGNLDVMRVLLKLGADANVLDHRGDSMLHGAFQNQNLDAMEILVKGGADVNVRNKFNSTLLHEASASGNINVIELLLRLQADANALDRWRDSPLHKAFRYHDAVKLLVDGGADVYARNEFNSTALHEASGSGNLDVIQLLLSHRADVNVLDHRGYSPLHRAFQYQKFEAMELLVERGADVDVQDKFNSTLLHEASKGGNLDVIQLLLSHRADVNVLDQWGDCPLHKAFQYQKFNAVKLLVNGGADVNVRDKSNLTPLHEASRTGNLKVMQLLLSHGANVNVFDRWGNSPLHKAFQYQKTDAARLLIDRGADVNVRDKYDSTLLHEASGSGNLNIAQLLLGHGADVNALDRRGDFPLHKLFRSLAVEVEEPQDKGREEVAHDSYYKSIFRATNVRDNGRSTPLPDASQGENYAMAQLLLAHGADVNARGCLRKTPLQLASFEGAFDISRLLTEHGADVNAQNDEDQTSFSKVLARWCRWLAGFGIPVD